MFELRKQPLLAEEKLERGPEQENIAREREKILSNIIHSRVVKKFGDWIPGLNVAKISLEAAFGQNIEGRKLSHQERMVRVIETGSLLLVYVVLVEEILGDGVSTSIAGSALLSKFVALTGQIYLSKEEVQKIFSNFYLAHPQAGQIFQAISFGLSYFSPELFSNKPIQLNLK